eukprot:CAMPEP_0198149184 /NCGR_PEP_ID=MMETSP1443-20131203/45319_1 /TAXON_ID=186043 /ORGANISM="Entomoneis sp., Strain CCMP2396" /LENGTH=67 /DNA_ID=CAMNT_0043814131 /DNA_START=295 /DNA_END=498 /DNA_ORIENTATION=-
MPPADAIELLVDRSILSDGPEKEWGTSVLCEDAIERSLLSDLSILSDGPGGVWGTSKPCEDIIDGLL